MAIYLKDIIQIWKVDIINYLKICRLNIGKICSNRLMECKKLRLLLGHKIQKNLQLLLLIESFIFLMKMVRKKINLQLDLLKKITKVILCAQLHFLQITKKLQLLSLTTFYSFIKLGQNGEKRNLFATNSYKTVL